MSNTLNKTIGYLRNRCVARPVEKHLFFLMIVAIVFLCVFVICWFGPSANGTHNSPQIDEFQYGKENATPDLSEGSSAIIAKKRQRVRQAGTRHGTDVQEDLFPNCELSLSALESRGLSEEQARAVKTAYDEIFQAISMRLSEHFMSHCKEEMTGDGSYIYVLKGDPLLARDLENEMRSRLNEEISTSMTGFDLASEIVEQMKGNVLLRFGADDMVGAAYRGLDLEGKWADGILINAMPGMIDYYRENGWPEGKDIHQSAGKAVFYPIRKPR